MITSYIFRPGVTLPFATSNCKPKISFKIPSFGTVISTKLANLHKISENQKQTKRNPQNIFPSL